MRTVEPVAAEDQRAQVGQVAQGGRHGAVELRGLQDKRDDVEVSADDAVPEGEVARAVPGRVAHWPAVDAPSPVVPRECCLQCLSVSAGSPYSSYHCRFIAQ